MNLKNKLSANWRVGLTGAALAVFLGLGCLFFPPGKGIENLSYDLPYLFRPATMIDGVAIIEMDDESHDLLDQPELMAWNQSLHAQIIHRLTECGAKAVVFDVLFKATTTNDAELLRAITDATNANTLVIVAGKTTALSKGESTLGPHADTPFDALAEAVPWGLVEASDNDRTIREHFRPGMLYPTLAWLTAQLTLTNPPANENALRWINYYGRPGKIPHYSFARVLEPNSNIQPMAFSNKVVYVGANYQTPFTGGTGMDFFQSPWSRWTVDRYPGVEVNATAYLNLKRADWLRRFQPTSEFFLVMLIGSLAGFVLPLFRPTLSVLVALAAVFATTVFAVWTMWHSFAWFSWMTIVGVQIPAALGWSVLAHTKRLQHEKEELEEKLTVASATRAPDPPIVVPVRQTAMGGSLPASGESPTVVDGTGAGIIAGPGHPDPPRVPDHVLLRKVGAGAYGEIWLARNAIGTYHVVKIVRRQSFDSPDPYEREFRGIQKFMPISRSHPGLVQILHVGRNDPLAYIYYIMEVADDESTGQEIDPETYSPKNLGREIKRRGRIPAEECLQLSIDLTAALEFMHQQHLIHRDIKPSNIIFVRGVPKFADIGLVTEIATKGEEVTYLGTRGYIAPEGPGTPAADVYSLGKVIYEASMGQDCQQFPELPSTLLLRPDRAELFRLNEIVLKACSDNLAERYRTAKALRDDLLGLQRQLDP